MRKAPPGWGGVTKKAGPGEGHDLAPSGALTCLGSQCSGFSLAPIGATE